MRRQEESSGSCDGSTETGAAPGSSSRCRGRMRAPRELVPLDRLPRGGWAVVRTGRGVALTAGGLAAGLLLLAVGCLLVFVEVLTPHNGVVGCGSWIPDTGTVQVGD